MSNKKYSLLYPLESAEYKKISPTALHDLGLDQICKQLTPKESEQNLIMNTMSKLCADPFVTQYRCDIFEDMIHHKEMRESLMKILDKIKGILRGKDIIKSSDEDAIERLEEKLDALKENQERMRVVNKAIRLKNTKKGDEELKILGYSDEQIEELRTPDFMGRVGFPAYALQNNNANIHRVEERLKSLKAVKEKGTKEMEFELFKVVENVEAMRLQIIFDEKPEADVRAVLKKNGFKWAPSQGAWQRMLNPAGKYALNRVKEELEAV